MGRYRDSGICTELSAVQDQGQFCLEAVEARLRGAELRRAGALIFPGKMSYLIST